MVHQNFLIACCGFISASSSKMPSLYWKRVQGRLLFHRSNELRIELCVRWYKQGVSVNVIFFHSIRGTIWVVGASACMPVKCALRDSRQAGEDDAQSDAVSRKSKGGFRRCGKICDEWILRRHCNLSGFLTESQDHRRELREVKCTLAIKNVIVLLAFCFSYSSTHVNCCRMD